MDIDQLTEKAQEVIGRAQAIARRHGVTVAQLQSWNGLSGTRLVAGKSLVVQAPRARSTAAAGRQVASSAAQTRTRPN